MNNTIYESPDGGNTIYEREYGSRDRKLIANNIDPYQSAKSRLSYADWVYANVLAEHHSALQEARDKFILLYNLVREHGQTKYSK